MRAARLHRRGFSLIEVLVALAIFGLAATLLGSAYINVLLGYQAAAQVEVYEDDLRFVRAQVIAEPERERLEQGGDVDLPGNRKARWTASLEPMALPDLYRVTLEVELPEPANAPPGGLLGPARLSGPREHTETFVILRPTWSDPVERSERLAEAKDRITELNQQRLNP